MTQINLQRVRHLRQQIIAETSHTFADWNLVQKLLDELVDNHQQYKQFALKENITPYSENLETCAVRVADGTGFWVI